MGTRQFVDLQRCILFGLLDFLIPFKSEILKFFLVCFFQLVDFLLMLEFMPLDHHVVSIFPNVNGIAKLLFSQVEVTLVSTYVNVSLHLMKQLTHFSFMYMTPCFILLNIPVVHFFVLFLIICEHS